MPYIFARYGLFDGIMLNVFAIFIKYIPAAERAKLDVLIANNTKNTGAN
ncbi:MAG: hypothetical protein LBT09_14730 [Planctomycetaceae bacterium]|nr:hypothetical protein [Planctomycetaceae bacterium]